MHPVFFLLLALSANGLLRNKGLTNSVDYTSDCVEKDKAKGGDNSYGEMFVPEKNNVDLFYNTYDDEKYLSDFHDIVELPKGEGYDKSFLQNCTINSCVMLESKEGDIVEQREGKDMTNMMIETGHMKEAKETEVAKETKETEVVKKANETEEAKETGKGDTSKVKENEKKNEGGMINSIHGNDDKNDHGEGSNGLEENKKNETAQNQKREENEKDEQKKMEEIKSINEMNEGESKTAGKGEEGDDGEMEEYEEKEDAEDDFEEEEEGEELDEEEDEKKGKKKKGEEKGGGEGKEVGEGKSKEEGGVKKDDFEKGKEKSEDKKDDFEKGKEKSEDKKENVEKSKDNGADKDSDKKDMEENAARKKEKNGEGVEEKEEEEMENEAEEEEEEGEMNEIEDEEESEEKGEGLNGNKSGGSSGKGENDGKKKNEEIVGEFVEETSSHGKIDTTKADIKTGKVNNDSVKSEGEHKHIQNVEEKKVVPLKRGDEFDGATAPPTVPLKKRQVKERVEESSKKRDKKYESHMFTLDKKMHRKLTSIDGILRGLNEKLNRHKDLKNRELRLKFETMGRIKEHKIYSDLIQKSIEILTLRLMKINEDLKKLKDSSDVALQKYINENGYGLRKFSDLTNYDKAEEEMIINRNRERGKDKMGKLYCPMDCNRDSCFNRPVHPTQCYVKAPNEETINKQWIRRCGHFESKFEQRGSEINKICEPFIDVYNGTCRSGLNHCAIAEPERNKKYSIFAISEHGGTPQFITIRGYNLHECLQLLVVHKGSQCSPSSIEKNLMESSEILSEPVSMKLLHNEILFENIKIIMPGEYNLCIAQFYQQPEKEEMLANNASNKNKKKRKNDIKIMGIDTIGTLYVLPLPMKK